MEPNNNLNNEHLEPKKENEVKETSDAALICGIIGIFVAGIILGIITIILSRWPESKNKQAALILGIIDIVLPVFTAFMFVIFSFI